LYDRLRLRTSGRREWAAVAQEPSLEMTEGMTASDWVRLFAAVRAGERVDL